MRVRDIGFEILFSMGRIFLEMRFFKQSDAPGPIVQCIWRLEHRGSYTVSDCGWSAFLPQVFDWLIARFDGKIVRTHMAKE
jgi:hypothetical protein